MSRKIEKILSEVIAAKQLINTHEDGVPYVLRAGIGIQIAGAKERLPALLEEIKAATIPSRVVGCFASGDPSKVEEVKASILENRGVCIDASKIYNDIADAIEPSMGEARKFDVTQHNLLVEEMISLANRFNLPFVDPPSYTDAVVATRTDLLNHVRAKIVSTSPFFVTKAVTEELLAAVVDLGLVDRKFPVLVLNTSSEDRQALTPLFAVSGPFSFGTDFEVSKEGITTVFRSLK